MLSRQPAQPGRTHARRHAAAAASLLLASLGACAPTTLVKFVVDTDIDDPGLEVAAVVTVATGTAGRTATALQQLSRAAGTLPGPFAVAPAANAPRNASGHASFTVTSHGRAPLFTREVDFAFTDGRITVVTVLLSAACVGVACGAGETCANWGACSASAVTPAPVVGADPLHATCGAGCPAGSACVGRSCVRCGAPGDPCCVGAAACVDGATRCYTAAGRSWDVCGPCGATGEPCCAADATSPGVCREPGARCAADAAGGDARCLQCGAVGQACCPDPAHACDPGSQCGADQRCAACGAVGQACCAGATPTCAPGGVCASDGRCAPCGGDGLACCEGAAACTAPGHACNAQRLCGPAGAVGQPCTALQTCADGALRCVQLGVLRSMDYHGAVCVAGLPAGTLGGPCGAGGACPAGAVCAARQLSIMGPVEAYCVACGEAGEVCCTGAQCGAGLRCDPAAIHCVAGGV